ncbi:MAG: XdhC family protein [Chloroflexi bacterium]|nr:XdhC family protein [Chloroflexota bacterium]
MTNLLAEVRRRVDAEAAVVAATIISSPRGAGARMLIFPDRTTAGSLGDPDLDRRAADDGIDQLLRGTSKTREYPGDGGETAVFYDVYAAPDRLLIFGGVHIAVPLAKLAKILEFRVTVVDARGQFANRDRFPIADEIVVAYADEYLANARLDLSTYVVVLSHDPKLDDPALIHALQYHVRYIGAIGSRRTHAKRVERLREAGLTDEQIGRIHAPIGLNIDARNPEEIALAILAEMIAAKNGVATSASPGRPKAEAAARA